ncbi:hypothetical protein Dimus_022631 [Dionaea muscipula]
MSFRMHRMPSKGGRLHAEVGEGDSDHACWERPEDMTTPRTVHKIEEENPGSDLAGETTAASIIVFDGMDEGIQAQLLSHAKELFHFATNFQGKYSDSIPAVREFYSRSSTESMISSMLQLRRSLVLVVYADYLRDAGQALKCPAALVNPHDLIVCQISGIIFPIAKLNTYGARIQGTSAYMVGFESNYLPRATSPQRHIDCVHQEGSNKGRIPNIINRVIVGGPDQDDNYNDGRGNYLQVGPNTATVAPLVGVLASIASG